MIRCGNRAYETHSHDTATEVRECFDRAADEAGEIYAEAVSSWVTSGGAPEDASRYASVIAAGRTWDGGAGEPDWDQGTCEHGLAAALCVGPSHYPMDM